MANWIRCDSPNSAKALLAFIASGFFNSGSHPHCRMSTVSPNSVDVDFGPEPGTCLQEILNQPQVKEIGPLEGVELPDMWANREEMVRILLTC